MHPPATSLYPSQNLTRNDISDCDGDQWGVLAFLEGVGMVASKHDLGGCGSSGPPSGEVHQVRVMLGTPLLSIGLGEELQYLCRYLCKI